MESLFPGRRLQGQVARCWASRSQSEGNFRDEGHTPRKLGSKIIRCGSRRQKLFPNHQGSTP